MLFNCFTSPERPRQVGKGGHNEAETQLHIQRVSSKKTFDLILQRASSRGSLVIVEWAANWCSLCLEADLEFAIFALGLRREERQNVQLVRVNLDKAEELAIDYKIVTLPSFSIFQDSQLAEHYTGIESCKLMHKRLQLPNAEQSSLARLEGIVALGDQQDLVSSGTEAADWDASTCSTASDCSASLHDNLAIRRSRAERSTSLDNTSRYLPRYKRRRGGSLDSDASQQIGRLARS